MSALAALEAARAAGVRLKVEGNDLVLEASAAPPSAVLDLLSRNKAGIATNYDRALVGGRPRTGTLSSPSERVSLSLMVRCRARKRRSEPSPAA